MHGQRELTQKAQEDNGTGSGYRQNEPCEDVPAQINVAKSALNGCGKVVLEGHIKNCVRDGIEHGDADKTIESFTRAIERFSNMS